MLSCCQTEKLVSGYALKVLKSTAQQSAVIIHGVTELQPPPGGTEGGAILTYKRKKHQSQCYSGSTLQ